MVKRLLSWRRNVYVSFTKPVEPGDAPERRGVVDWIDWARALFALLATLALILALAWGARRLGMLRAGPSAPKRLKVSESLLIDPRRRLVIVRCDGREHLILLGPGGDIVVSETAAAEPAESPT